MKNNFLLTGLPRSGTTLSVSLLNCIPNTIALHEPIQFSEYRLETKTANLEIIRYIENTRASILNDHCIKTKVIEGNSDNSFGLSVDSNGKRLSKEPYKNLVVDKRLTKDFNLVIKHPMAFTALLEVLVTAFPVFALVRNPLPTILSWNSISAPISCGRAPQAELRDTGLKALLDAEPDCLNRQILIANWMFERYVTFLPPSSVIKYEDLVSSNGEILSTIISSGISIQKSLSSMNANPLYSRPLVDVLCKRLIEYGGAWMNFYHVDDVLSICHDMLSSNA
jgi:hypothetical protein